MANWKEFTPTSDHNNNLIANNYIMPALVSAASPECSTINNQIKNKVNPNDISNPLLISATSTSLSLPVRPW